MTTPTRRKEPGTGRAVAMTAVLLGVAMSIAGNALHVTTVGPASKDVSVPQVVISMFWPVALLIAVEVIARVRWPDNHTGFAIVRWGGAVIVGTVAAIVSYRHMHGLLLHWGEDTITALLGPIGVDGLVSVGAVALMAIGRATTTPPATKPNTETAPAPAPAPKPAPAIAPSKTAPAPVESQQVEPPKDSSAGDMVNVSQLRQFSLGSKLESEVANKLRNVLASGNRPEPTDLADFGVPAGVASKLIDRAVNGSVPVST